VKNFLVWVNLFRNIKINDRTIKPGSVEAKKLKEEMVKNNMWSQYLEVGLMEYCEIFTKSQPLSSVGYGSKIGLVLFIIKYSS
jgi:fumarylacetoacetate (FAA) hydrolase family protein